MRLSALDAFFVAYQESSGVLMQLGVEIELKGRIRREEVEQMLVRLVQRWPELGQRVSKRVFGLAWTGEVLTSEMLRTAEKQEAVAEWRNKRLDPFREPPF